MDALLQIIVPEIKSIEGIEIHRPVYTIDNVEYSREPAMLSHGGLSLHFDETTAYLTRFLPPSYIGKDWIWLKVPDQTLEDFDLSVKSGVECASPTLDDFLRILLSSVDRWVVAFILHYDQIDHTYKMDVEGVIRNLRTNLERGFSTEGFLAHA